MWAGVVCPAVVNNDIVVAAARSRLPRVSKGRPALGLVGTHQVIAPFLYDQMFVVEAAAVVAQVAHLPQVVALLQLLVLAERDERQVVQVYIVALAFLCVVVDGAVAGASARDEFAQVAAQGVGGEVTLAQHVERFRLGQLGVLADGVRAMLKQSAVVFGALPLGLEAGYTGLRWGLVP